MNEWMDEWTRMKYYFKMKIRNKQNWLFRGIRSGTFFHVGEWVGLTKEGPAGRRPMNNEQWPPGNWTSGRTAGHTKADRVLGSSSSFVVVSSLARAPSLSVCLSVCLCLSRVVLRSQARDSSSISRPLDCILGPVSCRFQASHFAVLTFWLWYKF
jgi:hypothetical protein